MGKRSPGQNEIYNYILKQETWISVNDIMKEFDIELRSILNKKMLQLWRYKFVERKQNNKNSWGNEYLYRAIKND